MIEQTPTSRRRQIAKARTKLAKAATSNQRRRAKHQLGRLHIKTRKGE